MGDDAPDIQADMINIQNDFPSFNNINNINNIDNEPPANENNALPLHPQQNNEQLNEQLNEQQSERTDEISNMISNMMGEIQM